MTQVPDGPAIERRREGVGFWIHVTPGARREAIRGLHDDALRVDVKARPVEGKANAACVRMLAEALELPRSAVRIDPAARSRRKRVLVSGDPEHVVAQLRALAAGSGLG